MKTLRKTLQTLLGLLLFISTIHVDAASQFGMRRFTSGTLTPTVVQAVPANYIYTNSRFVSAKPSSGQTYGIATYEAEDKEYDRFSEHTAEQKAEGKIEGKIELLIDDGLTNGQILEKLQPKHPALSLNQIEKIRAGMTLAE